MARSSAAKCATKRCGSSADSREIAARRMRGGPALRAFAECFDLGVRQLGGDVAEHLPRLVDGHRKLGCPDLDELSRKAVPVEQDRWVGPRREHDPQLRRSVLDQMSDVAECRPLVQAVDVVQDQHHRLVVLRNAVDEQRGRVEWRSSAGLAAELPQVGHALRDGGRDRVPHPRPRIVVLVQAHPADGPLTLPPCGPLRKQRRLPEPRRRRHERQGGRGPVGEQLMQARTRNGLHWHARRKQLRCREWRDDGQRRLPSEHRSCEVVLLPWG